MCPVYLHYLIYTTYDSTKQDPNNLYLYKIESLNLVIVCVVDANAKHDISYSTGFSMFRRWMLAHYISDFVSVAKIKPRKSYAPDIEE